MYSLQIRRGKLINNRMEWSEWELWIKNYNFNTLNDAEAAMKLFSRADRQFRAFKI